MQSIDATDAPTNRQAPSGSGSLADVFGANRALTKAQAAYLELRERIMDGTLAPGMHFDQGALAAALGYSTTPIREAVRWLSGEGLVTANAHREMQIAPLSIEELTQLYAVRLRLDPWAAGLAARNADDSDRKRVRAAALELGAPTPLGRLRANRALHQAMYEASKNEVLNSTLNSLWDRSDRYRMILVKDDTESQVAHDEHLEIIDAFLSGDAEGLERLMYEHLLDSSTRILQFVREREANLAT